MHRKVSDSKYYLRQAFRHSSNCNMRLVFLVAQGLTGISNQSQHKPTQKDGKEVIDLTNDDESGKRESTINAEIKSLKVSSINLLWSNFRPQTIPPSGDYILWRKLFKICLTRCKQVIPSSLYQTDKTVEDTLEQVHRLHASTAKSSTDTCSIL
jgi:hypothetical protein